MDRKQQANYRRHQRVAQLLLDDATEIAAVPALARAGAAYQGRLGAVAPAQDQQQSHARGGARIAKDGRTETLIAQAVKAGNALYLLHQTAGNAAKAAEFPRVPTDLRLPDLELAAEVRFVAREARAQAAALAADYNLPEPQLAAFEAASREWDTRINAPQQEQDQRQAGTRSLAQTLRELDAELRDTLRPAFELVKDTHAELYERFRRAARQEEPGYRKRKDDEGDGQTGGQAGA